MKTTSGTYFLAGRILLAAIFLISGLNKIMQPAATRGYMEQAGLPMAGLLLLLTILVEVGGGLSLLLGLYTRWGALLLFLFMIPTTLVFHRNLSDPNQMVHFLKNLAIMGGLLYVAEAGPGRISIDAKRQPERITRPDVMEPPRRSAA
jgi:putative oxidoreductase